VTLCPSLGVTYCLERGGPGPHSPVHGTVEAVIAISLGGSIIAKAILKGDNREAEIVANIGARKAAGGRGLMTPEYL